MAEDNKNNQDEYEKVCYVCRRSESKAGPMVRMPGGICMCQDCLQKSFDAAITMTGGDFSKLMPQDGAGNLPASPENGTGSTADEDGTDSRNSGNGFPGMNSPFGFSMVLTPEEIQSMLGRRPMPKSVKKTENSEAPKIDMKKMPAPHRISEMLSE